MRLLRVIMVAASFAALLAKPSAAQDERPFHDAWFMGVRGGLLNYSTESDAAGPANGTRNATPMAEMIDGRTMSTAEFPLGPAQAQPPAFTIRARRASTAA